MRCNCVLFALIWVSGLGCHVLWANGGRDCEGNGTESSCFTRARPAGHAQGDGARAIFLFVQSLSLEENWPNNRLLTSAAGHLAHHQHEAASADLAQFLKAYPDHGNARFCHAELLLHMGKLSLARKQFGELIDRCPDTLPEDEYLLLHCHGRLTEIGAALNDEFAVHLHRGIGLYLLAISPMPPGDDDPDVSNESLLCKAMSELCQAQELRPTEARPCWYLHAVYSKLGQPHLAWRWLRAARQAAPFTQLSPAEQRGLALAGDGLTDRLRPAIIPS